MTWDDLEHVLELMERRTDHTHIVYASINEIFDAFEEGDAEEIYEECVYSKDDVEQSKEEFAHYSKLLGAWLGRNENFESRIYFDDEFLDWQMFEILYTPTDEPEIITKGLGESKRRSELYEPVFKHLEDNDFAYRMEDAEEEILAD